MKDDTTRRTGVRRLFGGSRYATVTSTVALVLALSGTAYAAATVTSADIVNGTIQGLDIRTGTVASADIATNGVTAADIAGNAVASGDIANETVQSEDIAFHTITNEDLADGSIETEVIVDDSISQADLGTDSVGGDEVVDGSITAADLAAPASPVYFAVVGPGGQLLRSSPEVASAAKDATGVYNVAFSTDISQCAWTATAGGGGADTVSTQVGDSETEITVVTFFDGNSFDTTFHLIVAC